MACLCLPDPLRSAFCGSYILAKQPRAGFTGYSTMPRPWTLADDHILRSMYTCANAPMQLIRNTLHRNTHDIHGRADELGLVRPNREARKIVPPLPKTQPTPPFRGAASLPAAQAANILRRHGYAPVYAQRCSDHSTSETGLWVVGRKLLRPDELTALAVKCEHQ